jgi:FlaA1/EpsC-like NDP-sugar epimerase
MSAAYRYFEESIVLRRVLAFVFHLAGILGAYFLAFQLRFDFDVADWRWATFRQTLPWVIVAYVACILIFRLYQGLWRFFTLRDCLITTIAFSVGTGLAATSIYLVRGNSFELYPRSVLVVTFLLLLLWEIGGRGMVRLSRETSQNRRTRQVTDKRLLLIGDPEEADALLRGMQKHASELGRVVGLVSDEKQHHGSQLRGVRIYSGVDRVGEFVERLNVSTLLFLPPFTGPARIRSVIDDLSERQLACDYRVIPSIDELASGKLSVSGIRKVAIEDLLQRVPYEIASDLLSTTLGGKKILVSGAGGSIGSEICRQLLRYQPSTIVLYEISEFHLFKIEREIAEEAKAKGVRVIACAGDVRRGEQLRAAIRAADGVDLFYHAAAYKHVDLMERNPVACFQNNVVGTQIAVSIAEEEGVKDFVLISTDKAVRPTSLMGASKRLAERLVIERPANGTSCKAVRFGNVLGSNGSVVPIFREQIARGGPVTVTSADVTRFFMTIPEAVELVLAAGAIPEDRRIFVLEMGEAVKIDSMARRMIELSGLVPDVDIPVVYTGLKPGEKEYEELLTDDENVVRTDMDRIWVVKKNANEDAESVDLGKVLEMIDDGDGQALREYAHRLIRGSLLLDVRPVA